MGENRSRGARPENRACVSGTSAVHGGRARSRARRLVLQGLYQWQLADTPVRDIAAQLSGNANPRDVDIEYFSVLLRETVSSSDGLQEILATHLDRPVTQLDPVERGILLLGACELKSHPEVPYRVVLNEAVELARKFGAEDGHKYINAVLERVCAEFRPGEFNRAVPSK